MKKFVLKKYLAAANNENVDNDDTAAVAGVSESKMYIITKEQKRTIKKFNLVGNVVEFKLKDVPENQDALCWFKDGVNQLIEDALEGIEPNDYVGITFCSKDFLEKGPGFLTFRKASTLTFNDVWSILSKIFQSNANALNTDTFCLSVTSVRLPIGEGRKRDYRNFEEMSRFCKGVIQIKNNDNLCLPRALVTAIAQHSIDKGWKQKVRRDIEKVQTQLTNDLLKESRVRIPENGAGIEELQKFQNYLQAYIITVYQYREKKKGSEVIFRGDVNTENKVALNLIYNNNHYNVITSLTAAFCCNYFCELCTKAYEHEDAHFCRAKCYSCKKSPPCAKEFDLSCIKCKRTFVSTHCFDKHISSMSSRTSCENLRKCTFCSKLVKRDVELHRCNDIYCTICKCYQDRNHYCYIQPDMRKPMLNNHLFIFFDFETRQDLIYGEDSLSKQHEVNLCVFSQKCDECIDTMGQKCSKCIIQQHVFTESPVQKLVEYILNQGKVYKGITCIAHNGQAFDHQFILNHIMHKTTIEPVLIQRGTKILLLKIGNIRFIDSLSYFPMKLSSLTKAFDLPSDLNKGYFPHLFNTLENTNYVGKLPAVEFYCPDTLKGTEANEKNDERRIFLNWYDEHKNDIFDMKKEIVKYCRADVDILTAACIKFRRDFLTMCNVCPFTEATTIASACNLVFRRNFLKPASIGIIPNKGYRKGDNQSQIAIQWLLWEEKQRNIKIIHAYSNNEMCIEGLKVDGFCKETSQIFEFHGCFYHGHPECQIFNRNKQIHKEQDTLNNRFERTVNKIDMLRNRGYEVIEKWECHFREEIKELPEINDLKKNPIFLNSPLNPREAFYGGRTENIRAYYKIQSNEKIKYIDVCSLYPWVCKYGKFPVGHPKIHLGNNDCNSIDFKSIDGVIKCTILPPQSLLHPVLPQRQNEKLMFVLCNECGETLNQNECDHNEVKRALNGTWIIDEVVKAIEKGYKILEIQEIWEYKVVQYNPKSRQGGLFTEMMNKFLKIKQSASGFPSNCQTKEDKEKYIEHFFQTEGIKLEFSEILANAGLRSLAKLMLNSFWGKFGQRENQPKTTIVYEPDKLFQLLTDPSIEVNNTIPINEKCLTVNWTFKHEIDEKLPFINVCIAAYTTTQARLKLYEYIEKLRERVIYYDTDSIIYISKDNSNEYEPPTGSCIGEMTNELDVYGNGSYISEFVSGGPKNYAYKVWSTKEQRDKFVCKVKGININYESSKLINFSTMKDLVLGVPDGDDDNQIIHVLSNNFRRTQAREILSRQESKIYKINHTKRKFKDDIFLPYGFKKLKSSE